MVANSGKSEIIEFYRNKNILITGASGFLGRLLVEKCLRQCDVKKLYILVRAKKGTSPKDRLQSLFQVPLFDELRAQRPDFMNKIELVEGDVSLPELGISPGVRSILVEKIQIVFHGAATVNFEEPLKRATAINVKGSRDMALLCKEMKHLQALVHVSTAFCHSPREEIREMFYDAPISADNLIKLTDCLSEDQLNKITKTLLAEWPNTYAFTKAVAEDAIKNYASDLPTCVFRPGVVISTLKDPIPGWIDNVYGPSGLIAGTGAGLLRVCRMDNDAKCDFVPADFCINAMMAAGYKTNLLGPDTEIPIFNFTTAKENPLTLREFHRMLKVIAHEIPPIQAVWYITMTGTKSAFWFSILSFLYHILPALIIDTVLFILQKKPQAMKIYRKIHKFSGVLAYFATRTWDFHTNNLQALRNGLNKTDQELFDFDMRSLDWGETIRANARGIRKYIMKEDESNVPAAKRRMFFLHALHRFVQLIIFGIFMWFSLSVLSPVIQSVVR